jgi:hypothetical protein
MSVHPQDATRDFIGTAIGGRGGIRPYGIFAQRDTIPAAIVSAFLFQFLHCTHCCMHLHRRLSFVRLGYLIIFGFISAAYSCGISLRRTVIAFAILSKR